MPTAVLVIYATTNLGAGVALYGTLRGLQMLTAILLYLPAGKLAERWGQRPFITLTFCFFALFPLVFALYPLLSPENITPFLIVAFIVAGLREIGEPARKGLIVDLAGEERRGEVVGVYYLIRGFCVAAAPLFGAYLWQFSPTWTFAVAAVFGIAGAVFYISRGPG
jgi:MFS family permease